MAVTDFRNSAPRPSLPLTDLQVKDVQAHAGHSNDDASIRKVSENSSDVRHQHMDTTTQPRRRKRDMFLALFGIKNSAKQTPPVELPVAYRNGNHSDVMVSGKRVPYSRPMHRNRRYKMTKRIPPAIPEEMQVGTVTGRPNKTGESDVSKWLYQQHLIH